MNNLETKQRTKFNVLQNPKLTNKYVIKTFGSNVIINGVC